MSATFDALTAKLTAVSIPLCPRPEVGQVFNMAIIFSVLIAVWSGLRPYARHVRYAPLNVEDALYYTSVCAFYGMLVSLFIALYLGAVGYHINQLQRNHVERLTQSILAIQTLYALSMCTAKWSILWMLKRIFDIPVFRILTWSIIIVQAAWAVMTILIGFLICRPVVKNWDPAVPGTCGNQIAAYTAATRHISAESQDALQNAHCLSTVAFSSIRLTVLRKIDFDDFSFSVPRVITWTYAESGVVLLVACSPLLRPVFDNFFRSFLSSAPKSSENTPTGPTTDPRSTSHDRTPSCITLDNSDETLELGQYGNSETISTTGSTQELTSPTDDCGQRGNVIVAKTMLKTIGLVGKQV